MSNFVVIAVCLILGFLFKKFKIVTADSYKTINIWIINVGLPAIALRFIPSIDWSNDYLLIVLLPFVVFGGSYIFFNFLNLFLKLSKRTLYTLILVAGLSNTSFVGFPLITSFFGEAFLKIGILSDQTTFFILSSLGVLLASNVFKNSNSLTDKCAVVLKRIITFPPFIACLIALIFKNQLNNNEFSTFFSAFSVTVTPLALFSIGIQLKFKRLLKELRIILLGLSYKLLIAPILCLCILLILNCKGPIFQVGLFEMSMPCLVSTSIIVQHYGLNTKLANTIIGMSIIVGLILSFAWHGVIVTLL